MTAPVEKYQISHKAEKFSSRIKRVHLEADRFLRMALGGYYFFAIAFSLIHSSWMIGIGISSITLITLYLMKVLMPRSTLYQYATSAGLAVFAALFIYQGHGSLAMHYWYAIGAIIITVYQNWRLLIPLASIGLFHHFLFSYFNQLRLPEFYYNPSGFETWPMVFFHAFLLVVVFLLCGLLAYLKYQQSVDAFHGRQELIGQLRNVEKSIHFAEKIKEGKLDDKYESEENDRLGQALLDMRKSLQAAAIREEQEKFITTGIAEIGDVLRDQEKLKDLSIKLLIKLVNYVGVNMGGLFILQGEDDEQASMELVACYAYGKRKYLDKRVEKGIGLLGQLMHEKETKYITDIPETYTKISSGIGEALPKSILLVPLTNNQQFVGAIELASFYPIEPYKITLIERVAENVAGAILNVRNNEQTRMLLEKSQRMTELMKVQEDQLKKNMEAIQANHESSIMKEIKMKEEIQRLQAELRKYVDLGDDDFHG